MKPIHKERKLTWQDVLDCKYYPKRIDNFLEIVRVSGYKYFAWNGSVFYLISIDGYLTFSDTGISVETLA